MTHLQIVDLQIKLEKLLPALRAMRFDLYKKDGRLVFSTPASAAHPGEVWLTTSADGVPLCCSVIFEARFYGEVEIAERLLNAVERMKHEEPRLVREYRAAQQPAPAPIPAPQPLAAPCREAERPQLPPPAGQHRRRRFAALCRHVVGGYWRRRQRGAPLR